MDFNSVSNVNKQWENAKSLGKVSTMLDLIIGQTNSVICDVNKKYLDEKQKCINEKIEESKNISSKDNNLSIKENKSHLDRINNNGSNKKSAAISRL